uniref:Putative c2h2-type zn-finger protein n=1 Tax=Culex tarsalis TaxID=7177 RepID=A0A1Q3EWZ2_CULTA
MALKLLSGNRQLCRLCLTDQDELYPIFGGEVPDLAEQIYDCTRVEIINGDGMSALICQQCRAKIVVCQHFFGNCQKGDRKYRQLFGPQQRQQEPEESKPTLVDVRKSQPEVPPMVVTNGAIPTKNAVLDRLKNGDQPRRRYSIDEVRKVDIKHVAKKRLSEESHVANTSMELLAMKIEQSIKKETEQKDEVDGKRECSKCGLLVHNLQQHKHKDKSCNQPNPTPVSKHVCGICNRTFSKRVLLKYHVNHHTGERPYKCQECDKSFANPTNLYRHKQIHTEFIRSEDQRYHCNVCQCVFKHRKLICNHMRTNHRERKFPCETCGKAYFTKEYLHKHIKLVHRKAAK